MDLEFKFGRMDQNIKEIIKKVKNMERGNLLGIKDHIIKDNSL